MWLDFSEQAVVEARRENRPVLVKFTANWCLNCQYIEATVYHDPRTVEALNKEGVVAIKADLTHESAAGWPLLKQLSPVGGIPLTAIWRPGADEPILLASVYTTQTLLDTLGAGQ
jgi:thiol:disulfide interchange protein DsbD